MNKHQDIWVMVGFSFDYVRAQIKNQQLEEEYKNLVKNSRYQFSPEDRRKSGDGERRTSPTRQIAFEPLPAFFLLCLFESPIDPETP